MVDTSVSMEATDDASESSPSDEEWNIANSSVANTTGVGSSMMSVGDEALCETSLSLGVDRGTSPVADVRRASTGPAWDDPVSLPVNLGLGPQVTLSLRLKPVDSCLHS